MPAKTIVKIIFLIIITILAFVTIICGKLVPLKKYKGKEDYRTRTIVRIRMGCFLVMLVLLLVVILVK